MKRRAILADGAPAPIGPYSQAVKVGPWLYVAGQIPKRSGAGQIASGSIAEQTEVVMENLRAIVECAGGRLRDAVKVTVYLADIEAFKEMNEVYARYFSEDPPARACVEVSRLPADVGVEMDMVAYIP